MSKIVKASDPTIIHVFDGYYFDPIINQAYSAKVPCYGTERLYTLKPTKSGKFRFYDLVYSTEHIHGILKRNDLTKYSEIMAQATTSKKTIEGAVKVRINNETEFNQVVKAFQTLGYDWASPGQPYRNNTVGVFAGTTHSTSITYSMDSGYFNNHMAKLLTIPELMAIAYPSKNEVETKWYDLKAGDKVKIDGHHHVYTVEAVEPKTYDGELVVEFTERLLTGEREGSFWATKSTKFVKVNSTEPQISQPVATTKGWIIGNLNSDSKIEISDNPKIHGTIESTETERNRLMNKHVGQTFVILEIKSYGKIETNPVTKIW